MHRNSLLGLAKSRWRAIFVQCILHFLGFSSQHLLCLVEQILLSAGASVNATSYNGDTALMWATLNGDLQILKVRSRIRNHS